uniref:Uncharacterized protein n=1 Tax=Arundo donax TaxID=35708 RepID=A0A0A8ZMV9_ARUDO
MLNIARFEENRLSFSFVFLWYFDSMQACIIMLYTTFGHCLSNHGFKWYCFSSRFVATDPSITLTKNLYSIFLLHHSLYI